jgi:hypothetical protein
VVPDDLAAQQEVEILRLDHQERVRVGGVPGAHNVPIYADLAEWYDLASPRHQHGAGRAAIGVHGDAIQHTLHVARHEAVRRRRVVESTAVQDAGPRAGLVDPQVGYRRGGWVQEYLLDARGEGFRGRCGFGGAVGFAVGGLVLARNVIRCETCHLGSCVATSDPVRKRKRFVSDVVAVVVAVPVGRTVIGRARKFNLKLNELLEA